MQNWGRGKLFKCMLTSILTFCLIAGNIPAAIAQEPDQQNITLSQAISLALDNSESVKKAGKEIDKNKEWYDYRVDNMGYVPSESSGTAYVEVPWYQLLSSDLQLQISKKGLTIEEDKVILDTCNKYWNVLKEQKKVEAAEEGARSALLQLQVARAAGQVGMSLLPNMSSTQAIIAAEAQYKAAQGTLTSKQNDLNKAYENFDKAVGLELKALPVLCDTVSYQTLEIDDLNAEITRIVEGSPTIWEAEQAARLTEYVKDMTLYTGEYKPYEARKIEVEQAYLDTANTKKSFDSITRILYYGTKSLEESYTAAMESMKVAEENLRVIKLKFDVGMATATEVAAEETKLADAKATAFELACTHEYMKLAFQKPWAYDASAMQ